MVYSPIGYNSRDLNIIGGGEVTWTDGVITNRQKGRKWLWVSFGNRYILLFRPRYFVIITDLIGIILLI